jgi:hypothetical protein
MGDAEMGAGEAVTGEFVTGDIVPLLLHNGLPRHKVP